MIGHLRVKSPWSQLGLFLGLLGVGLMITSLVLAAILLGRGIPVAAMDKLDWSQPKVLATMKLVQAISSITIFLLPALIFSLIVFTRKKLYFMGFRPPAQPQMYILAIVCILIAFPFVAWLGDLNQAIPLPEWMTRMEKDAGRQMALFLKAGNTFDIILNVFIIAFLPALCEEFFFRGMLQRIIINITKNPLAGMIIT
ncbi:MAG: hypothetical protein H0X41_09550, partial [Chitinophagaceae bacterium]|nr:hypothetical protein [Chitinophagaceae bacterium]